MSDIYRDHLRRRLVECDVPEQLHAGLVEYLAARRPVGGFLTAVLSNDLCGACVRADDVCAPLIPRVVFFLINYATAECWGSKARVDAWLASAEAVRPVFE
jgi:hypothetical protein